MKYTIFVFIAIAVLFTFCGIAALYKYTEMESAKRIFISLLSIVVLGSVIYLAITIAEKAEKYNNKQTPRNSKPPPSVEAPLEQSACGGYAPRFQGVAANNAPPHSNKTGGAKYKGVCLFDVDGTLTSCSRKTNEQAVDVCLQAGFAVGINTAGAMYSTSNIHLFDWMPMNLYDFMKNNDFDTFNNVASGVLRGIRDPAAYKHISKKSPRGLLPGWLKGFALEKTAAKYGISDPSRMIIFDDSSWFLEGLQKYNKKLNTVCAGRDCGGRLNADLAKYAIGLAK